MSYRLSHFSHSGIQNEVIAIEFLTLMHALIHALKKVHLTFLNLQTAFPFNYFI
jgi:hypothetical protein